MNNWIVETNEYSEPIIPHNGNKFLIGNGYMGIRGTMDEHNKKHLCSINLAGIYDKVGDLWRESVNAPYALWTAVEVDGELYALPEKQPEHHIQKLDFYNAVHYRKTIWCTPKGKISIKSERFASMDNQHLVGIKYSICADYDCEVIIKSGIDGDVWDINGPHLTELQISEENGVKQITGVTGESKIKVTSADFITTDFENERNVEKNVNSIIDKISFKAKANTGYSIRKISAVYTSSDENKFVTDISKVTYEDLKNAHTEKWNNIWEMSKIEIIGDDEAMYALNYSIYHMNCIAPRNLRNVSIPARGLSGQVYKGAVFWDTEMFMIDYYIHTEPEIAKTLINYRIDTLDGARKKAREYGYNGAYYAWESQEGGFEACSKYNITDVFTKRPIRTYFRDKQYHVSSAVVYGICKYINATGDTTIFENGGAEVIIECAMMYRSLLLKKADSDFYEVHDVVGPDEYHERVNNNAYTNKMIKLTFETAINAIDTLKNTYSEKYELLGVKYNFEELRDKFVDSFEHIYIPAPNENGVIEQFDGYFDLEDASIDEVRSRLIDPKEYWGGAYGVASDTQVLKQADVVAMLGIFGNEYDRAILKSNFEYYEPRTEHGSSLSACMYSLLACKTGNAEIAYPLFLKSASVDLNTGGKEWLGLIYIGGTHPASEGGAWIVAVKGFAGIDIKDGKLVSNPCLPEKWQGMKFKLAFMNKLYLVEINKNSGKITEI